MVCLTYFARFFRHFLFFILFFLIIRLSALLVRGSGLVARSILPGAPGPAAPPDVRSPGARLPHLVPEGDSVYELLVGSGF